MSDVCVVYCMLDPSNDITRSNLFAYGVEAHSKKLLLNKKYRRFHDLSGFVRTSKYPACVYRFGNACECSFFC